MSALDDLIKLAKKERQLRIIVESIQEFVDNYQETRDKCSVEARMKKLDEVYDMFCDVRMEIECLLESCDEEKLETARQQKQQKQQKQSEEENSKILKQFVNEYFTLKQALSSLTCTSTASRDAEHSRLSSHQTSSTMRVKLPDLKLPTFRGVLMEWITFRDTFQNLIADNDVRKYVSRSMSDSCEIGRAHV